MAKVRELRTAWGVSEIGLTLPSIVFVAGMVVAATGRIAGFGIAIGACLAFLNAVVLLKRVELAIASDNAAIATVSMQVGLLSTFAVIGAVTVILLLTSVPMAVGMAVTFFAVETAEFALFYRSRRRADTVPAGARSV